MLPRAGAFRLMFYIDDGLDFGRHALLQHLLNFLASHDAKAPGIHLRDDKCEVWLLSAPAAIIRAGRKYPSCLPARCPAAL